MSVERRNSVLSYATSRKSNANEKTYIKVLHGDNKTLILNSFCSCLHLLNYVKEKLQLSNDDTIDFIDLEGFVKEIPTNNRDYAIHHLSPTNSYVILKIDVDPQTGDKRYTPLLHESKLNNSILKSLSNLNTGKAVPGKDKIKKEAKKPTTQTLNTGQKSSTQATRKSSKK